MEDQEYEQDIEDEIQRVVELMRSQGKTDPVKLMLARKAAKEAIQQLEFALQSIRERVDLDEVEVSYQKIRALNIPRDHVECIGAGMALERAKAGQQVVERLMA